jgi:dienelactone hydrolase
LYEDHQDLLYVQDAAGVRQPIRTVEDWAVRRRHVLEGWQSVAGTLPGESFRVPLDVKTVEETRVGGLTRRKVTFQSDPFDRVSAWLLIPPRENDAKLPAMLALHQTTQPGKDEAAGLVGSANMRYGLELAQRGYVVICPDYPSLGEHPYDFASNFEFASGTLKGVWDNQRAVDLLTTLPEVDAERIGVIGHSLGGHNAIFTAIWEPRLKVVVSSCGFTRFGRDDVPSWNGPRYMPRIATVFGNDASRLPFDFTELVAAIAPRPFLACAATMDDDFDVRGVREVMAAAGDIYKLHGNERNLQEDYPDGPHDFPQSVRERAYKFVDQHLRP